MSQTWYIMSFRCWDTTKITIKMCGGKYNIRWEKKQAMDFFG